MAVLPGNIWQAALPELQTRQAQLALKGCLGQTSGPGTAFFFGFDSPQTLGCSLVPFFGGWVAEGKGVFLLIFFLS